MQVYVLAAHPSTHLVENVHTKRNEHSLAAPTHNSHITHPPDTHSTPLSHTWTKKRWLSYTHISLPNESTTIAALHCFPHIPIPAGSCPAPAQAGCEADQAVAGSGRLCQRAPRRPLQARTLQVLEESGPFS